MNLLYLQSTLNDEWNFQAYKINFSGILSAFRAIFIVNIISVQNRLYVRFKWYVTWRITQFSNLLTPHWSSIVNWGDLKTSAWDALHHFTNKYCPINRSMSYQSQTHVTCYEKWPWPNFRVVLEYKNVHILKNVLTSIFYRF